ncbi:hypothetical protein MVEN_00770600 [Mycena venus]|uniref:Stalled ribosome sensor GCN1-like HEAT repeats region domain-containing protein n=1 Tax=Mycena venus TaxID=2733690 RepID=A0A8H6YJW3_9AGAR|nr:hypothetical protein MVEN_00770600 [Mycena venus]
MSHCAKLLELPRWMVWDKACGLVEKLVQHDSTLPAILKSKACVLLVSLLPDEDFEVAQSAQNALSWIAQRLEDASAVDAKTLRHMLALLGSSNPEVRRWACDRVEGFARHRSSLPAVLESMVCAQVVSLLSDEYPDVVRSAQNVLSCIAQMLENAPAIVVKMLDHVLDLMESSNLKVCGWACD